MGLMQISSRIGAAFAPWVAKWLKVVHIILPFSLMGGSALISAVTLFWLPETQGKHTAETFGDEPKGNIGLYEMKKDLINMTVEEQDNFAYSES